MIFIVSIIIAFSFILSAVFIGFTPNVFRLVEKDVLREVYDNANMEAIQYGNLYLRAGVLDTNATTAELNSTIQTSRFTYVTNYSTSSIINIVNITSGITIEEDNGNKTIAVNVEKS